MLELQKKEFEEKERQKSKAKEEQKKMAIQKLKDEQTKNNSKEFFEAQRYEQRNKVLKRIQKVVKREEITAQSKSKRDAAKF